MTTPQPDEPPPLNAGLGAELAEEGMGRADLGASPNWKYRMDYAILAVAVEQPTFTVDDVWRRFRLLWGSEHGANPSAAGPAIRRAAVAGWIVKTGNTAQAERSTRHCNYRPVWRSLLCGERNA